MDGVSEPKNGVVEGEISAFLSPDGGLRTAATTERRPLMARRTSLPRSGRRGSRGSGVSSGVTTSSAYAVQDTAAGTAA